MKRCVLAAAFALALACDHPIAAVPTMATSTKTLAICWRDPDKGDDSADTALMNAIKSRLSSAGYHVLTKGVCDIDVSWKLSMKGTRSEEDESYREVTMTVRGDGPLDVIRLSFGPGEVPTKEPDRLAILMVNALNASSKVADYARKNDAPKLRNVDSDSDSEE
jgi:hypothetical protein